MAKRCSVTVVIVNRLGLHARPAMEFVDSASAFASTITVCKGDQRVDGKSIMQMMLLAATRGTELVVEAEGDDAEQACKALKDIVARGFGEE